MYPFMHTWVYLASFESNAAFLHGCDVGYPKTSVFAFARGADSSSRRDIEVLHAQLPVCQQINGQLAALAYLPAYVKQQVHFSWAQLY
jgi:hypothetical protein